jgi:hypothetical protein
MMRFERLIVLGVGALAVLASASYAGPYSNDITIMQTKIDAILEANCCGPASYSRGNGGNKPTADTVFNRYC